MLTPLVELPSSIWNFIVDKLYSWQDFAGALIGALTAVFIFLLTEWYKSKQEYKSHNHLLHRSIGTALDNLREIDATVTDFANNQLESLIRNVDLDIQNSKPTVCHAFVPLMNVFEISEELLKRSSGSGYIDILTIEVINRSKSLRRIIEDMNRQFESTISMNNQIALSGLNCNPVLQNQTFKKNLQQFKSKMLHTDHQSNIRTYASLLIKLQVTLEKLNEWKIMKWKRTFRHLEPDLIVEEIDHYFDDDIQKRKIKYQKAFQTRL